MTQLDQYWIDKLHAIGNDELVRSVQEVLYLVDFTERLPDRKEPAAVQSELDRFHTLMTRLSFQAKAHIAHHGTNTLTINDGFEVLARIEKACAIDYKPTSKLHELQIVGKSHPLYEHSGKYDQTRKLLRLYIYRIAQAHNLPFVRTESQPLHQLVLVIVEASKLDERFGDGVALTKEIVELHKALSPDISE